MRALFSVTSVAALSLGTLAACSAPADTSELTASASEHLDARVRAVGRLLCGGAPLANVPMQMMNSNSDTDTISDQTMGYGSTDGSGYFSFEGTGGDSGNGSWSGPDVYVRAVYDSYVGASRVRVTNELDNARDDATPQHNHDNQSAGATVQIGTINFLGSDCQLWVNATAAVADFQRVTGTRVPSKHYDIERWSGVYSGTPWTNLDTTHWPTNYAASALTAFHEFGHSVRHSLDGDSNHFNWDVSRFVYARYHSDSDKTNEGFAFNEGWAEYWAGARAGSWVTWQSPPNDWEIEGNVAMQLLTLSRCAGVGDAAMVNVLRAHPEAIHSMGEFQTYFNQAYPFACKPILVHPLGVPSTLEASPAHGAAAPDEMDVIRTHVADGSYGAWKKEMRASIVAKALGAKRAAAQSRLAALSDAADDTDAEAAQLREELLATDAIEASIARGEGVPIGLHP